MFTACYNSEITPSYKSFNFNFILKNERIIGKCKNITDPAETRNSIIEYKTKRPMSMFWKLKQQAGRKFWFLIFRIYNPPPENHENQKKIKASIMIK